MIRIFDITSKDLLQLLRSRMSFMFFLVMPIVFTFLFGFAFGGFSKTEPDPRLPVGYLDQDNSPLSQQLHGLLSASKVIRLDEDSGRSPADLEELVTKEKLAAAILVPSGYGQAALGDHAVRLTLITDSSKPAGTSVQNEALTAANRLASSLRIAGIVTRITGGDQVSYEKAFQKALISWQEPPISVAVTTSTAIQPKDPGMQSLAHTSPGMMLQFAIAGLLTCAQVMVYERKARTLQRMLTTATQRVHILLGHYLSILVMILGQFVLLITFGQLVLKIDYLHAPLATLLVALSSALCIASLGLMIGTFAKTDEQAITFSLIPMFVLAGLGGAWVPLEATGPTFQAIGHASPIAWAMDGFKNITARGLGLESVLVPSLALIGYAVLFFVLAAWRFQSSQEK